MNFTWSDETRTIRDQMVKFAASELCADLERRDRVSLFDRSLWEKCGRQGLQGICVPAELGGAGMEPLNASYVLEGFGKACRNNGLSFSLLAHIVSVCQPVCQFGNGNQKSKWLRGLCDGSVIGAHAMTETETGSDAFRMKTAAPFENGSYTLTGTKIFCTNAPTADVAVVFGVTNPKKNVFGGITAFLVDLSLPGVTKGQRYDTMGLRTSPIGELVFDRVQLTQDDVLGETGKGFAVFAHAMNWERALLFATHCGTMGRVLEDTIAHAKQRQQFGQSIGKFQAVSHRLAELKTKQEAARLLTFQAASLLESGAGHQPVEIAMAKLFVSETYVETTRLAIQILGASGYMTESGVEREHRDALGSTIYSGTSEIQKNLIASSMGL